MHTPKNKKIADLVRRMHNEAKLGRSGSALFEEGATQLRLQATQIERLQAEVLRK